MKKLLQTFGFLVAFCTSSYGTVITVINTNNSGIGSLREAIITTANNGDTIRFDPNLISAGSDTIILSTEIGFSKSLRIVGLYNTTDTLYISGNMNSRIFAITNTTKVTLDSLLLINGNGQGTLSNGSGGAVLFINSDSLFINYSIIRENTTGINGGGIYCNSNPSSVMITNSTINENTAGNYGGGFYSNNSTTTIVSSTISGNIANNGGGGIFSNSKLTLSDLIINNNTVTNGPGGGLLFSSYSAAPTLNNSTIRNNTAQSGGGIYYNGTDSLKIINSNIIGNTATGGSSTGNGGGGIFTRSPIMLSNSTVNNNVAVTGNGGGIYSRPTVDFSLTLTNSTVNGNVAGSDGGGFYSSTTNVFGDIIVKVSRSKICNNTANDNGGGFYLNYDPTSSSNIYNSSLIVSDSSIISNNSATNGSGGGFYLYSDGLDSSFSMIIDSSVFSNNDAIYEVGGGFFSKTDSPSSKIIVNNVTISDNTARNGGGCSIETNWRDSITMINSTISGNSASNVAGGFRIHFDYADSCSVTLNNLTITDNISGNKGGGVYISYFTTNFGILSLREDNLTITGNTAAVLGGGIYHQIPSGSNIMLTSSIVALNGNSNIVNGFSSTFPFTSGGYNIFDDAPVTSIATDQINVTALQLNLQPLAYYGGTTQTMIPGAGSVAINLGNPTDATDAQNRPISGVRDVGAAESCTQTSYSSINPSACSSYTSPSGFYTWVSSGVYTDIIPNAFGCDSIITINLTINSTSSTITSNTCNSYTSPSGNYSWSSSGIYMDTIPNTLGCDSIMTINLTIDSSSSNITINACSSYTSPSGNYTWSSNGIYMDTIPNTLGCDSIITINLTINNNTYSTITPNSCDSYTSPSGNYTWVSNGIYMDTIPNTVGCDSVITINLTINPLPNVSIVAFNPDTLCDNGSPVVLPTGTPSGGNYSGVGVGSGNFDPSIAGVGTHQVIYTYTDSNTCINSDTTTVTVEICTGIDNVINDFGILIYPNPNNGLFTIEKPNGLNKAVQVKLLDVNSKLILEKAIPIGNQEVEMDIRNYSKGIYYLHLIIDDEDFVKQILKN